MLSSSPQRNTFLQDKYIERCKEEGKEPDPTTLKMYEMDRVNRMHKFDDLESRVNSLEYDLRTTDWILEKVRNSEFYAQNLYAAMCNTDFIKNDIWQVLKEEKWSCSWRYAGGIIADMRQEGDYMDWYCSGSGWMDDEGNMKPRVGEGIVTDEIRDDLLKLGWIVIADGE